MAELRRRRCSGFEAEQSDENQGVKKPQPAQDHSQVVTGAAQHRVHRIVERTFEPIAIGFSVDLHVSDGWLDRASPPDHHARASHDAASQARVIDLHTVSGNTLIAAIDDGGLRLNVAQDHRLRQRVRLDRSTGGFVCKSSSPAINRGEVAGRPVRDTVRAEPAQRRLRLLRRSQTLFEFRDTAFEFFEARAGAKQHLRLRIEFLASDEIELRETLREHGFHIAFDVFRRRVLEQIAHAILKILK